MGQLLDILAADAAGDCAQADAAFRALREEQAKRAERATLNSAGQAIDASLQAGFQEIYPDLCKELRAEVEAEETDPVRASDAAMEVAGRADRAFKYGDRAAAADLYRTAAQMLVAAAEVAEE